MRIKAVVLFLLFFCLTRQHIFAAPEPDTAYKQAISLKYLPVAALKSSTLKKVVTDYNGVVYVLSDSGVLRIDGNDLVRDLRYTPLAAKVPVDIAVQDGAGHLYYLYDDKVLTNGYAGMPYVALPKGKYTKLAIASDGSMLLSGTNALAVCKNGERTEIPMPADELLAVCAVKGVFYGLSSTAVYRLRDQQLAILHRGTGLQSLAVFNDTIMVGTGKGYYGIDREKGDTVTRLQSNLPVQDVRHLAIVGGKIWAGSQQGAFRQDTAGTYRYYASQRWLNDDKVIGICEDRNGDAYVLTAGGLNKVQFISHTLLQKTNYFQEKIRQRHIRYGFISNVTLTKPGDLSTAQMTDTDNDGLWSAFYLGSQAFRYAVTKDKTAKRYAWEAFEAFERIISVNPLKGFPARTFERKGFKHSDPERWHPSQDPEWEWKGTTSSDEFVGYIYIAAMLHEMVAETADEKKRVAHFIGQILDHIIRNNYNLVDADGKPTLWGRWNPDYINSFPNTVSDRKLGSVTIIAGLQLGYALTGKALYRKEAMRLMDRYGYLRNMMVPYSNIKSTPGVIHMGVDLGTGPWNHSDDEMAFLSYWVLYRYAFDKALREQYAKLILDHWQIEQPERNALWNLITLATAGSFDKTSTLWHLRAFPMDLVRWDIKNSHRKDIVLLPPNFRRQLTKDLLPPDETPIHRHNANAFELDGGERGLSELAGDEYLLPYWMARYLKVIE